MTSPIIFVSDLHGGLRLPHAKVSPDSSTSDRLEDCLSVIEEIRDYAIKHKVGHCFVLGDVFDKAHPDAPTLIKMSRALRRLSEVCEVWLLPGNHDAHDASGRIYSLQLFDELKVPNLHIMLGDPVEVDGVCFWPIPWVPEKKFEERLNEVHSKRASHKLASDTMEVLLFHQTIRSAHEGGFIAKHGIPGKIIAGFDWALSGHIHKHQYFDTADGRYGMYLGSPICMRFTDASDEPDIDRGFWVMDADGEFERVPVHGPGFVRWAFVEDEDFTLQESCDEALDDLLDEMEEDLEDRPIYLQVMVEGFREEVDKTVDRIAAGVTALKHKKNLRMCRWDRRYLDDGAGARARKFATKSGAVTDPMTLSRSFVSASATKLAEAGMSSAELLEFLDEEGILT